MATLSLPKRDEDLFQDTAMTFGEHLDALRVALFKAISGLVVGVIIGLFLADYVVALLAAPLEKALTTYYTTKAEETFQRLVDECAAIGKTPPAYTPEQINTLMHDHQLLFEVKYMHPQVVARQIGAAAPDAPDVEFAALEPFVGFHKVTDDSRISPKTLNPSEGFSIWMKAGLVAGAILSSPWVFYHIWAFVAAGLYPHEKRYVHIFLPFSLGLFLLGAATAYLFVFGPVLDFLFGFNKSMGMDPDLRISELIGFVLLLPLGFGISFQLPLVMLFMERIGVFDVRGYLEKWRISVLVIFILSAILTPADPYSLLLMAIPLCFLYFGGIGLCHLMPKRGGLEE